MLEASRRSQEEDLEHLRLLITLMPRSVLIFGLFRIPADIDQVQQALAEKIDVPIVRRILNQNQLNPLRFVRELPPEPRTVVFAEYEGNLTDQLKECAGYANLGREILSTVNHPLVMWFREEAFARFIRQAPDFWAWHSTVVEFQSPASENTVQQAIEITEQPRPPQVNLEMLQQRAESYRELLASYSGIITDEDKPYLARTHLRLADTLYHIASKPALDEALEEVKIAYEYANEVEDLNLKAQAADAKGYILSALGLREEALSPTQEALDIYRELAKTNPDAFLSDIAMSLHNLGIRLSDLGKREEALQAAQEAVDIHRELAKTNPDAFLPNMAFSLNNLGTMLRDLGKREEALPAIQEALGIRRELAKTNPDAFLPDVAGSLNNLGNRLSDLGKREEALQAAQEALDIYRELAKTNPDAFLPDVAGTLNNLGADLSALGRTQEALLSSREAIETYRMLAQHNPAAFDWYLAVSLLTLSRIYRDLDRLEDCQDTAEAGLEKLLPYWRAYPQMYQDWALGLIRNFVLAGKDLGDEPEILIRDLSEILGNQELAMQLVGRFWQGL